jgi:hypothetical protein
MGGMGGPGGMGGTGGRDASTPDASPDRAPDTSPPDRTPDASTPDAAPDMSTPDTAPTPDVAAPDVGTPEVGVDAGCAALPAGTGTGLRGQYYDTIDFMGSAMTRVDPTVDFDWMLGPPIAGIDPESFSVRWTGQVQPRHTGVYTFYATSDDGVRVFVNGQMVIDHFVKHPASEMSGTITLTAGQRYDVRVDFYDDTDQAVIRLSWSHACQSKEIVPATQLYQPM